MKRKSGRREERTGDDKGSISNNDGPHAKPHGAGAAASAQIKKKVLFNFKNMRMNFEAFTI